MIQSNYDLAKPLSTALKAKAPYVGIPFPGHAPLIFKRELLTRSLKGVRVVNVEVLTDPHNNDSRYMVVDGIAGERWSGKVCLGRTRHHMKVRAIPRATLLHNGTSEHCRTFARWIEMERKPKALSVPTGKTAKYQKAIAKLEKRLAKLGDRPKIFNPATATPCGYGTDEGAREQWLRWREQKDLRRRIGATTRIAKNSKELYTAMREMGLTKIKTFSQLNTAERRSLASLPDEDEISRGVRREGSFFEYAKPKNLWRFQPGMLTSRPEIWAWDMDDQKRWGAKRYEVVLEWSREKKDLLNQIAGIRAMLEDISEGQATS